LGVKGPPFDVFPGRFFGSSPRLITCEQNVVSTDNNIIYANLQHWRCDMAQ